MRSLVLAAAALLLPGIARADEPSAPRVRLALTGDLSGGRSWLFQVPIDEAGARAGVGVLVRMGDRSSFEGTGGFSIGLGSTEAGRSLSRFATGVTGVFHLGILRLGIGGDLGTMKISTARSSPDNAVYGEVRAILGVEPLELGKLRPYLDLHVRTRVWAESELMSGPALALGVRY